MNGFLKMVPLDFGSGTKESLVIFFFKEVLKVKLRCRALTSNLKVKK